MRQSLLFKEEKICLEHGGSLLKGKRKGRRPIVVSKPLHMVLRSERAVGKHSLIRFETEVTAVLAATALKFQVKVYKFAINRNHLHLCIKGTDRKGIIAFERVFAGVLAKRILLISQSKLTKFWTERIYSRIVQWNRDFKGVLKYIEQNELEVKGEVPYTPRKRQKKRSYRLPNECHQYR